MAGNDTAALVVALSAQLTKFERDMQQAGRIADRQVSSIEERFARFSPSIKPLLSAAVIAGAIASIKSVIDALAELGDKSTDLRLPVEDLQALSVGAQQARVSGDELNKALTTFSDVSKKNADDGKDFYKALQNIGGGFAQAFKDAPSQSERLRILGQAMASTNDEVKRAQLGLAAFGSDSERVTSFVATLGSGMDTLKQRAKDLGIQIDTAMVKQAQTAQTQLGTLAQIVSTELTVAIGSLIPTLVSLLPKLQAIGAAARDALASFAPADKRPTETLKNELRDSVATISSYDRELRELLSKRDTASTAKIPLIGTSDREKIDDRISELRRLSTEELKFADQREAILERRKKQEEADKANATKPPPAFQSRDPLNPKKEGNDAFDRTIEQITRQTAVLKADTLAVFENNAARSELRAEFQLLNAIRKDEGEVTQEQLDRFTQLRASMSAEQALVQARINLTPAHKQAFLEAAAGAREATTNFDAANKALNQLNAASSQVGSALANSFADAILEGKKLNEVVSSLLKNLARAGINSSFSSLFNAPASGGLSPVASLFKGFFAEGGYTGSGGKFQPAGIVHRGEYVMDAATVQRLGLPFLDRLRGFAEGGFVGPVIPAARSAGASGPAPIAVTYAPRIDARGADAAAVARLASVIADDRKNFERNVQGVVGKTRANQPGSFR